MTNPTKTMTPALRHADRVRRTYNPKPEPAASRVAERAARNTPWHRPTIYDREEGPRDVLRAVLPLASDGPGTIAIKVLRQRLNEIAGGFTEYDARGHWEGDNEAVRVYEVSYKVADYYLKVQLEMAFIEAGHALGETWLHIEYHPAAFFARHVKVRQDHVETA